MEQIARSAGGDFVEISALQYLHPYEIAAARRFRLLCRRFSALAVDAISRTGPRLSAVLAVSPPRFFEALPLRGVARSLFWDTLQLSFLTTLFALLFGVVCALAIARGPQRFRFSALLLSALPLALPPTLGATAWLEWTRTPPLRALASLGGARSDFAPSWSQMWVMALVLACSFFPLVALPLSAVLRALPRQWEDAARNLGGNWWQWRVALWPLLWPVLAASCGAVACLAMWEMGAPDLIDIKTYSVQIYRDLSAPDALDPDGKAIKAALAALPACALAWLALWPARRFTRGRIAFTGSAESEIPTQRDGIWATFLALAIWCVALLAPVGVFASQIGLSGNEVWARVWDSNHQEISNSILLAAIGTILIVILSALLVGAWKHWPQRWANVARDVAIAPLLIAPILIGVALISCYNRPGWDWIYAGPPPTGNAIFDEIGGWIARYGLMIIGYITRFLPISVWLLDAFARGDDANLEDAARNVGANGWQIARDIRWPLWKSALGGIAALVWALCAGELSTSVLINAPGGQTLPVPVFNLMHIGSTREVAALSLTLLALCASSIILAAMIWRGKRRNG